MNIITRSPCSARVVLEPGEDGFDFPPCIPPFAFFGVFRLPFARYTTTARAFVRPLAFTRSLAELEGLFRFLG
jgi:hypothetical protein